MNFTDDTIDVIAKVMQHVICRGYDGAVDAHGEALVRICYELEAHILESPDYVMRGKYMARCNVHGDELEINQETA